MSKTLKTVTIVASVLLVVALIVILVPKSTSSAQEGNYAISGDRIPVGVEVAASKYVKASDTITFPGWGSYTVSNIAPTIELTNPKQNKVSFVYTVSDKDTGEVIGQTEPVLPGEYAYVNVVDYYKAIGDYNVTVQIDTYTSDGVQMNGISEAMALKIVKGGTSV